MVGRWPDGKRWKGGPGGEAGSRSQSPAAEANLEAGAGRGEQFSPRGLSSEWSEPLSNLSYHIRVLAELGVIKLTATRPVRGSTQHFYVSSPKADLPWVRTVLGIGPSPA